MQSMKMLAVVVFMSAGALALPMNGFAAHSNKYSVVVAAGRAVSSNSFHTTVLVVGQVATPGITTNAGYTNESGFFTFMLASQDHDHDGIPDELDLDDDNDGIPDLVELAGTDFNPATPTDVFSADSDGDGSTDLEEMRAGTNPTSTNSLFEMDAVSLEDGQMVLSWIGHGNFQYQVIRAPTLQELRSSPTIIRTVTVSGGAGDWMDTQAETTNVVDTEEGFYGIRLMR